MPSLLDDLRNDLMAEAIAKPVRSRIGTGPRDVPSLRHTEWSNAQTFVDGGYIALVLRQSCESCGGVSSHLRGIFHCEIKADGASRRLQRLDPRAQWPLQSGWKQEVESASIPFCPACLTSLGFDLIVETPALYTLIPE